MVPQQYSLNVHLKMSVLVYIESFQVFSIPTGKIEREWQELWQWLTLLASVRNSLEDKSMLFRLTFSLVKTHGHSRAGYCTFS